jgi:thiol-disulfide isomerase/thioredoxin
MLEALLIVARLLLAAVFVVAAVTKLADRDGTREAVAEFGAPRSLALPLAILLPIVELAVAVFLLPAATAMAGLVGALMLLLVFSGAIAWNLARGRTPDCHCFGQLHSAPAGGGALARNGALAAVAALAVAGTAAEPGVSAVAWIGRLDGPDLLAFVVVAVAAILLVAAGAAFLTLLRSYGKVLLRVERLERVLAEAGIQVEAPEPVPEVGLPPGAPAPAFAVADIGGASVSLEDLLAPGQPLLLMFMSPRCGPCQELLPAVAEWQGEHAERLTVAIAGDGTTEELRAEASEFDLDRILADEDGDVYSAYEANGTPSAVLVAPDGTIASYVASGRDAIETLVGDIFDVPGLPVGASVPGLRLRALDGERVALEDLNGRDTLLLFWNSDCGFCRAMHSDLLRWERKANGTPRLVVISSGDEDRTREEGFRSTVLLDEEHRVGSAFGADGTPMAVLIGADGRVASRPVAGADAVFTLANGHGRVEVIRRTS